jgi:MFS transporter, DHA1 family, tetracycline resistance protein
VTTAPAEADARIARRRLPLLFLTVFVDLVGFGIILPLLPFYATRFGASALVIGLLVTSYSVAQFFMAPLWGRLSDRFGRRPILLLGLVGSAVSYLVFAWAGSVAMLFLSRVLAGVGGSTVPVAEAYIADVTPAERRAGNMGLIGAAFGLGFTVGPALGGILSTLSWQAPGYAAAALCFGNALLAFVFLPESRPGTGARAALAGASRRRRPPGFPFTLSGLRTSLGNPGLRRVLLLYFLITAAFAVIQPTLSLLGADRFGLGQERVGYLFAYLGLLSAVMQGGLVRHLVPRFGEVRLVRLSIVPFAGGLALMGVATTLPALLLALGLLAVGYGGALPSVISLVSRVAPADLQGGVLGVGQSVGSLARIVAPAAAGAAYGLAVPAPYLMGAAVAALGGIVVLGLEQPRARTLVEAP